MKKTILLLTSLIAIALTIVLSMAFSVPGPESRENAVGNLKKLSPGLQKAFNPNDPQFQPLPKPKPGDWLAQHKEPGQTFRQFLFSNPNKPGAHGRKFIYLQPIGNFPQKAPKLQTLQQFLQAYYHPMTTKLLPTIPLNKLTNVRTRHQQLHCPDLLKFLGQKVPKDAHVLMAVTMADLYPADDWNFVFGMAQLKKRCGVFSFHRYGIENDQKQALRRSLRTLAHETGHAFGIKHCIHFHCLMNGSNSLDESDRGPLHLCPMCLRKIHWGLKFKPHERYQKINTFLTKNDLTTEAKWFTSRSETTAPSNEFPPRDK